MLTLTAGCTPTPGDDWKHIPDFPGYLVHADGRVYSRKSCRVLAPSLDTAGYLKYTLSQAGVKKTRHLHRVLLLAFVGPCPRGHVASFKDGDISNVRLDNLEWVSQSEIKKTHPRRPATRRLTPDIVRQIRAHHASGKAISVIADILHFLPSTVKEVVYNRNWRHVL